MRSDPKQPHVEELRQLINQNIPEAVETDRAQASLCDLSYASSLHRTLSVWIGACWFTEEQQGIYLVELERWEINADWYDEVATIELQSPEEVIIAVRDWLTLDQIYSTQE